MYLLEAAHYQYKLRPQNNDHPRSGNGKQGKCDFERESLGNPQSRLSDQVH